MDGNTNQSLNDTAALLFSLLPPQKQDEVIDLLKSLLSEQSLSAAALCSTERTKK